MIQMKKLACLVVVVVVPLVSWAQSKGPEASLAQFHDRLALTVQQQDFWSAYESKVAAYTSAYYRQKPVVPAPEDSAPHQVGRMVDNLQNRLAALEELESAAKALDASLIPDQQKIANQLLISTIPTFTSADIGATLPTADAHHKENKPDSGKRAHRGGAGAGMAGPMPQN
jgi:hypothetical protein